MSFAKQAKDLGLVFADTPMSGGIYGAQAGTLTFMVGCEKDEFEHVCKVLKGMGPKHFHCGGPGTGEVAKLVNNLILGICMIGSSEGMAIGEKLGIDPKVLYDIIDASSGHNRALTVFTPHPRVKDNTPASRGYEGGFQTQLLIKDMALALEAANLANQKTDLTEKAMEFYTQIDKNGYGKKDFGYVFQHIMKNHEP